MIGAFISSSFLAVPAEGCRKEEGEHQEQKDGEQSEPPGEAELDEPEDRGEREQDEIPSKSLQII